MNRTIDELKIRIHMLEQKDIVGNSRIISKLRRKIRALESN